MTTNRDFYNNDSANWTRTCVVYDNNHFTVQTPTAIPEEILDRTQHQGSHNQVTYIGETQTPKQRKKRKDRPVTSHKNTPTDHKRLKQTNSKRKRQHTNTETNAGQTEGKKQKSSHEPTHNVTQQQLLITNFIVSPKQTSHYPISTTPAHNDLGVT